MSSCKARYYCSKGHQKLHWKTHKHECSSLSTSSKALPSAITSEISQKLFAEYSLVVEAEDLAEDTAENSADRQWSAAEEDSTDVDDDLRLRQADYSNALGTEAVDPLYVEFLSR